MPTRLEVTLIAIIEVEVLDDAASPFTVDVDDDASGLGVCSGRTNVNGNSNRRGHDLEERALDADAGSDAKGVAL